MNYVTKSGACLACCLLGGFFANPAFAAPQTITFSQSLLNSCVLTVNTDGTLNVRSSGTEMNSEPGTGTSAVLAVVAVGSVPQITFSAPVLTAPAEDSGSSHAIKYTSLSGANQAYTAAQSSYTGGLLIDAYTVDAKVENPGGFAAGGYQVTTTATCSQ